MHISYAHAVRGNFPDDFVGRERLREVFRLQSAMREEEEYWTSLLAIIELLKSGTVTFVDPGSTQFVDACLQAYADSGARVISGAGVVDRAVRPGPAVLCDCRGAHPHGRLHPRLRRPTGWPPPGVGHAVFARHLLGRAAQRRAAHRRRTTGRG